jgi:hypothetical protein
MVSGGAGEIETLRVFAAHVSRPGENLRLFIQFCIPVRNPMRALRSKMLNLGNNHEGIPLSLPSKFGIRHNLYKIDNVLHGPLIIS